MRADNLKCNVSASNCEVLCNENKNNQISHINNKIVCLYCTELVDIDNLDAHLNKTTGNCKKQQINCLYETIGCKAKFNRENNEAHMMDCIETHLRLIYEYMNENFNKLNESLAKKVNFCCCGKCETNKMDASNSNIETENQDYLETLEKRQHIIQLNQKCFNLDFSRIVLNYNNMKKENDLMRKDVNELKSSCQELHKNLALTRNSLIMLEEKIVNIEKSSHDGSYLWKIPNVKEKIEEAKSGRQAFITSAPFYTSRYGYKMCCKLYLNGDGIGRGTHASLYLVLLKGDYDSLLNWPFLHRVKFILKAQSNSSTTGSDNENNDHEDSFMGDPSSSSFKRPISDMNIASGLPTFCSLEKLLSSHSQFVKEDTMYIKIIVNLDS